MRTFPARNTLPAVILLAASAIPAAAWNRGAPGKPAAPPFDPRIEITKVSRNGAVILWRSARPGKGVVRLRPARAGRADPAEGLPGGKGMILPVAGARAVTAREDRPAANHRVAVKGLRPGRRYLVEVRPAATDDFTEGPAFYAAPRAGRTQVLSLRVAVLVFTNVTGEGDAKRPGAKKPAPPGEVERIRREIATNALFYYINSGMRLSLDIDFYTWNDLVVIPPKTPYGVAFGRGENRVLERVLKKRNRKPADYDGFCFVSCEKVFRGNRWIFPASGGGTYGPLPPYGIGRSAWKSGGNNGWLFCHEFGHQLDALFDKSGEKTFLFNHFQPWDDTAHCHGEHFDGNAWILREWAGHVTREKQTGWRPGRLGFRYFTCRWGKVEEYADADDDGLPDRAPGLPLDEERFGSRPDRADTDGDGLPDPAEAMATNGVEYGLGEIWAGPAAAHRLDPANPDTDGDGLKDGADPAPLFPASTDIPFAHPRIDGAAGKGEWPWSADFRDEAFQAKIHFAWNEEGLYFAMKAPKAPRRVRLYLDADRDGWYVGRDNLHVEIRPGGGCRDHGPFRAAVSGIAEAALFNCGVPKKWPFYDNEGPGAGAVDAAAGGTMIEVKIARDETRGLSCRAGERIGLLIAVDPGTDTPRPGERGMLTLFEPHRLCGFRLVH